MTGFINVIFVFRTLVKAGSECGLWIRANIYSSSTFAESTFTPYEKAVKLGALNVDFAGELLPSAIVSLYQWLRLEYRALILAYIGYPDNNVIVAWSFIKTLGPSVQSTQQVVVLYEEADNIHLSRLLSVGLFGSFWIILQLWIVSYKNQT